MGNLLRLLQKPDASIPDIFLDFESKFIVGSHTCCGVSRCGRHGGRYSRRFSVTNEEGGRLASSGSAWLPKTGW